MANTIVRQVDLNGSVFYQLKVSIIGDGSGEETATILNATTGDLGTNSRIIGIRAALSGFSARILFDATSDEYVYQIPSDFNVDVDFRKSGALMNSLGAGNTGDILITTSGLGAGDSGVIYLDIKKS